MNHESWPPLPYADWADTYATLHLWTQIVGKIRLAHSPWINHSWHVPLYVTARGLTTSPIPDGDRTFEIEFDFIDHQLSIRASDGAESSIALRPRTVADFNRDVFERLGELGLGRDVVVHGRPNEIADPIPFADDHQHASYDADAAMRHWRILVSVERVMQRFRARFIGKNSPIHFFWGSFDFAVTRFSGRLAPPHPGGVPYLPDSVAREAYSHELSSAGFWAGGGPIDYPCFYCYAYPEPEGFARAPVEPKGAFYSDALREFILPYDVVRESPDPDAALMAFLQSTYEAAADLGGWDRGALEGDVDPRRG